MQDQTTSVVSQDAMSRVNQALDFAKSVTEVTITNNEQAEKATTLFRKLGTEIKDVDELREKEKKPHLEAGRAVDAFFNPALVSLKNFKSKLEQSIRAYQAEIERKLREEQARLDREAEEKRRKAEEAARLQREKEEAARRAEEDARRKAAEAANEEERKAALAEAEKRRKEAERAAAMAEKKTEAAVTTVAATANVIAPSFAGTSVRQNWKMEITNRQKFVQWAAADPSRHYMLMPDPSGCGVHAKQIKIETELPGARIFNDEKLTGRRI